MKDQHTLIKGYRDLSKVEVDLMNEIKDMGEHVGALVDKLAGKRSDLDQRWVAIGGTQLQLGIMALVRAVAQPTTF